MWDLFIYVSNMSQFSLAVVSLRKTKVNQDDLSMFALLRGMNYPHIKYHYSDALSFCHKNIFDKMDLRLFYFHVTI